MNSIWLLITDALRVAGVRIPGDQLPDAVQQSRESGQVRQGEPSTLNPETQTLNPKP